MILKFTGELCSMTMKNDAKFENLNFGLNIKNPHKFAL